MQTAPETPKSQRAREIQRAISEILLHEWDPIGIADIPEAADEYDSYVGSIYSILAGSRSEEDLIARLQAIETMKMGFTPRPSDRRDDLRLVARSLLALDLSF